MGETVEEEQAGVSVTYSSSSVEAQPLICLGSREGGSCPGKEVVQDVL